MTGRHADASDKGALRDAVWWWLAPVALLAALAAVGVGAYCCFTSSNFLVTFSILWVVEAGILVRGLTRPRWKGAFFNWVMVGALIGTSYQIIAALVRQHIWLADHHVMGLISDWTRWIALVFIAISVVVGIRSGELLFWRSESTSESTSPPTDTEPDE
jgi:hypothetical protein